MVKTASTTRSAKSFNPRLLRGSLYVAKYLKDFRAFAPVITAEPVNYLPQDVPADDWRRATRTFALWRLADCAVRSDPVSARSLVLAPVGSKREDAAVAALSPHLLRCRSPEPPAQMSREQLIGVVAEVLYKLSIPASARVAAAGKN